MNTPSITPTTAAELANTLLIPRWLVVIIDDHPILDTKVLKAVVWVNQTYLFLPDPTAPHGTTRWWLLGECHGCGAVCVPTARIAHRSDLDAFLTDDGDMEADFWQQRNDNFCDCGPTIENDETR